MSSQPSTRSPGGRRARPLAAIAFAALIVAGCTTGASPAPPSVAAVASPVASAPVAATEPAASATPVEPGPPSVAIPAEPPVAVLTSDAGASAAGALGGYTWGEAGSDAPWIVPRARDRVAVSGRVVVALDPAVPPTSWRVSWAPITDGMPGIIAGTADGSGRITFDGPGDPGPWSLRVEAAFGSAGSASWYWRIAP